MYKKFIVKDFMDQLYYHGKNYGWGKESFLADYFDTIDDALIFIESFSKSFGGKYQIETVYIF